MHFTLLVWDIESLWITLWKIKLMLSQVVTPFIWRVIDHLNNSLAMALFCHIPFSQPMHMQGSNKIIPSGNTSQQSSSSSKQQHGQVNPPAKMKLSRHHGNSVIKPELQQTRMNRAQRTKAMTQTLRRTESSHLWGETSTHKSQNRLL